jgi:peptidoglycan/LPS O-acetylase OafA/YrhL
MFRIWSGWKKSCHDGQARSQLPSDSLNGLRGIAALFVFFFHVFFTYTSFHDYGYGSSPENKWLVQLPFVRIWYSGHAMIAIFFVVGGYVMSIKPLQSMKRNQPAAFVEALASSMFRRGFRLYVPAVIATFISMSTLYAGLWEFSRPYISAGYIFFDDHHIPRASSLGAQLWDWYQQTKALANVFTYYPVGRVMPAYPHYDPHLWTVPVEYRSSVVVAVVLLSLFRCRSRIRLILLITTLLFFAGSDRWELVCFLSGATLCQIDCMTGALSGSNPISLEDAEIEPKIFEIEGAIQSPLETLRFDKSLSTSLKSPLLRDAGYYLLFLVGIFLLCCPSSDIESTPGYGFLQYCTPSTYSDPKRFPHTAGALLVVYCIMRSPVLRRPFNSNFAQYFGRISYSLYIVHGPLNHIIGYAVTPTIWQRLTGNDTTWKWCLGLAMGTAILLPCVIVCAELYWRLIERWSINASRRLEAWCSGDRS